MLHRRTASPPARAGAAPGRRVALAITTGLLLSQVDAILNAGAFTDPDRTLTEDLASLAVRVGCRPAQVQAVLDGA